MRTPASIAGHPIHPMLIPIPIGLWLFSLVADLVALWSASPQVWSAVAFYTMVGGIVGALAAAVPGVIDLLSLKERPVRRTAVIHMSLNLSIVALFAVNAWLRYTGAVASSVALGLSLVAVALLVVSGWLGGKMVYQGGVGVDHEAAAASLRSGEWTHAREPRARAQQGTKVGGARWGERAMASDSGGPTRTREPRSAAGARDAAEADRNGGRVDR
jgi:uncharacterized membrane protein